MKRNSPEAIVGWMVIISNLGLSWFFLGEGEKAETNSFRNHKAWKGENETQQSGGDDAIAGFHSFINARVSGLGPGLLFSLLCLKKKRESTKTTHGFNDFNFERILTYYIRLL